MHSSWSRYGFANPLQYQSNQTHTIPVTCQKRISFKSLFWQPKSFVLVLQTSIRPPCPSKIFGRWQKHTLRYLLRCYIVSLMTEQNNMFAFNIWMLNVIAMFSKCRAKHAVNLALFNVEGLWCVSRRAASPPNMSRCVRILSDFHCSSVFRHAARVINCHFVAMLFWRCSFNYLLYI